MVKYISAVILAMSLVGLFGCRKAKVGEGKIAEDVARTNVSGHSASYCPLAAGNKWTYRRTVPQGRDPYFMVMYIMKKGKSRVISGRIPDCNGISTETYELLSPVSLEWYGSKRICFPLKLGSRTQRDGRYLDTTNVYWDTAFIETPGKPDEGPYYEELFIFHARRPVTGSDESPEWDYYFLWDAGSKSVGPTGCDDTFKVFGVMPAPEPVKVPAGEFRDCVMTATIRFPTHQAAEKMKPRDAFSQPRRTTASSDPNSLMHSWHTLSFYASGVGLVREQQYGPDGFENYTLELLSYSIARP